MSSHWTEAKLFKFLRLYKRYECLWNPYFIEYKSSDAKSEAFSQILYEMNVFGLTINECLNQIKYLRQTYKQEQQRLENLASLGGRGYSNLLWFPLMNSMLSKVILDEEKLNQETSSLDSVAVQTRLPSNSGDQRGRRKLPRVGYGRRTFPWNRSETTTLTPYLANPSYEHCYINPNILHNSNVIFSPNEHISSCPTCGYSSGRSCECLSMINNEYCHPDYSEDSYSARSRINYQPRTSYNYRNGILEINSAVRIPVSQPSTNCGYSRLIESITPEEPECNLDRVSSYRQPEVENVEEERLLPIEYCDDDKVIDGRHSDKIIEHVDYIDSYLSNSPISSSLFNETQNSVCRIMKHKKSGADDDDAVLNDRQNFRNNTHTPRVEYDKELCNVDEKNVGNSSKKDLTTTEAIVKVKQASTVASENEKENISSQLISQRKLRLGNEGSIHSEVCGGAPNLPVDFASASGGTKTRGRSKSPSSQGEINDRKEKMEKMFDAESVDDLVRESKTIVEQNLTKFVIDFIDKTLNKPDQETTFNAKERLILKKVAKDLRELRNERNCNCSKNLTPEDYPQPQSNCSQKSRNKTICWREPIEESFNIVSCKASRFPVEEINHQEDVSPESSKRLNKGTTHFSGLLAGADSDIEDDTMRCNFVSWKKTRSENKKTDTGDSNFSKNQLRTGGGADEPANSDEFYIKAEISSGVTRQNNLELLRPNDMKNEEYSVQIDKTSEVKESIDLENSRSTTTDPEKTWENQTDYSKLGNSVNCTTESITELENGVSLNISVKISDTTENERIDKVVFKITESLRKTLDRKGYTIEKREFFSKKNLITNDNGGINQKTIGNEVVWRTELRNIISSLMKHKKAGDSISFKVKTMILPVTNQSNLIAEGAANSNSTFYEPKTRNALDGTESAACTEQCESFDSEILINKSNKSCLTENKLSTNHLRRSRKVNKSVFRKLMFENSTNSDKDSIGSVMRIAERYDDHPYALLNLLKYLSKVEKKFHSVSKKHEESSHSKQQDNEFAMINDEEFDKEIDVYLCTEISERDQSPMQKDVGCDSYSRSSSGFDNVIQKSINRTANSKEDDVSEWGSLSESDEGAEIVKHCGSQTSELRFRKNMSYKRFKFAENFNRREKYSPNDYLQGSLVQLGRRSYSAVYALSESKINTFWYGKSTNDVEMEDSAVKPVKKDCFKLSEEAGVLKNPLNSQNDCNIIDIFSSNNQSSKQCSEANSLNSEFKESLVVNESRIPDRSDSKEGQSLLEAKLKTAANNRIKSCCIEDQTSDVCTPICDVTSRLRLCAIIKPAKERSAANPVVSSNNICCCDGIEKPTNIDAKTDLKPGRRNVRIGDANVKSMSVSLQTESIKTEQQSDATSRDCGSCFQGSNKEISSKDSLAIDSNGKTGNKDVKLLETVDRECNTRNMVSTLLNASAFEGGPLILEIKMLQPIFSIEIKKGHEDMEKAESSERHNKCDEQKLNAALSRESFFYESNIENDVLAPQQLNCIVKTPSKNSTIACAVQRVEVGDAELTLKKDVEEFCEMQTNLTCVMESDSSKRIETCLLDDDNQSPNSEALSNSEKSSHTSLEEKLEVLGSGGCNKWIDESRSLNCCETPRGIEIEKPSISDSVKSEEKEILPQLREDLFDEIKPTTIEDLISTIENCLETVTDPIIREKLVNAIKCIKNPDENQNQYQTSEEILSQDQIWDNSKRSSNGNEIQVSVESEVDIRRQSLLPITRGECQGSCEVDVNSTTSSAKTVGKIIDEVEILRHQNKAAEIKEVESLTSRDSIEEEAENQFSVNENQAELLTPGESFCRGTSRRKNNNHNEISKYHNCCDEVSAEVDIDAFANTIASQLRALSTEAALRSQQRIQTLISNSRLESEKSRKSR